MNRRDKRAKGFTVAQLLMFLAIFAVIVSLSLPLLMRELERSLESTDFSRVRTVYAQFMGDIIGGDSSAQINEIPILQPDGNYRVAIYPLSQRMDGWTLRIDNKTIGGIPSSEWIGVPRKYGACIISYYPRTDDVTIHWGTAFPLMSLKQLYAVSNKARVEEDQRLLRSLGEEILHQYWTPKKLRKTLELPGPEDGDAAKDGGPIRIATYAQLKKNADKSDGFRIISTKSDVLEKLLRAAGYEPGSIRSVKRKKEINRQTTTYEYSLFFSNELAANHFGGFSTEAARRAIYITDIKVKNDIISQLTIYTTAVDDEAAMTREEEGQFRITVSNVDPLKN